MPAFSVMSCKESPEHIFQQEYPHCYRVIRRALPDWQKFSAEFLPELFSVLPWLGDIVGIDRSWRQIRQEKSGSSAGFLPQRLAVNPYLEIVEAHWQGLPEMLAGSDMEIVEGQDYVAVYTVEGSDKPVLRSLTDHQLLALKIVAEQLDIQEIAAETGTTVAALHFLLKRAVADGLLLAPRSKISRWAQSAVRSDAIKSSSRYSVAEVFTLQWHLTQACDLHCRHCYDRNSSTCLTLQQGREVLQQLYRFCSRHHVTGQISFTGGNPLLYPHFFTLYREAVELGFITAILGNPTTEEILRRIIAINPPAFFQVSLEGLQPHNDTIRGEGHFARIMSFLALLRKYDIYSMVMLTLTKANQDGGGVSAISQRIQQGGTTA